MTPHSVLAFMSFGFGELIIIGTVALLVFGGQLPDVMRSLGRAYGKFRDGLNEVSRPVRDELRQVRDMPSPIEEARRAADEAAAMNGGTYEADAPPDAEEYPHDLDDPVGGDPWPSSGAPADTSPSPPPTFAGDDDDEPLPP